MPDSSKNSMNGGPPVRSHSSGTFGARVAEYRSYPRQALRSEYQRCNREAAASTIHPFRIPRDAGSIGTGLRSAGRTDARSHRPRIRSPTPENKRRFSLSSSTRIPVVVYSHGDFKNGSLRLLTCTMSPVLSFRTKVATVGIDERGRFINRSRDQTEDHEPVC